MKEWMKNVRQVVPYVPGEQPKETDIIKLNTNENPYPPSPKVQEMCSRIDNLRLYPDPAASRLVDAIADYKGVGRDQVFVGVGSDDVLAMSFLTFFNSGRPILFPDITYSFYDVWAELFRVPYETKALDEDFRIRPEDYYGENGGVIFPNPNAPTGILMPLAAIRDILDHNRDVVVIVDEAYIDFGGETAQSLLADYDNLLVVQTFSKSRSMAGARLGFAIGSAALIADLEAVKYSTNPYSLDRVTLAAGTAALTEESEAYHAANCRTVMENRAYTTEELTKRGFTVVPSLANFVFARLPGTDGAQLYDALRRQGVLVRHFNKPGIRDYLRITIGSKAEMDALLAALDVICNEKGE